MATNIQKFQLSQGGRNYILTSKIEGNCIILTCVESNVSNSPVYYGQFTLVQLCQLSKMFNTMTTISQALEFLNQSIENQKVSVEHQGNLINITLFFQRETETENIVTTDYSSQAINYNNAQPIVYNTVEQQDQYLQFPITTTQTTENVTETMNYIPETTNYEITQDNNIYTTNTDNQTYETAYDYGANYNTNYQTYENVDINTNTTTDVNYDLNLNNNVQYQSQINTYTTTIEKPKVETITLSLNPQIQTQIQPTPQVDVSKYLSEIELLKNQIKILREENTILKTKTVEKTVITKADNSGEILILRQEIERLKKQLEQYITIQTNFDEYKRAKEEEISLLKLKIEELLRTNKILEERLLEAQKTIEELRMELSKIISEKNYTESIIRQQKVSGGERQTLTIQDTRLEVVKGDILQSAAELELLTRKICRNYKKIRVDLLYKATIDSDEASAFHKKCDAATNTIVLVKSGNGKRFGGYTSCSWEGNSIEKKDENAFVFSLDKMTIYDIIKGEDAIGCYPKYGPVFLGCQIRIYDKFFKNGGTTFEKGLNYETQEDYELSGGLKEFSVKEIEVYGVELE